uniref:NAD-dependent epimerase/dehydratase domain-containing protein n=1 Tax=Eucampia antarctica TaxID=49252 RepID=A0A7S2R0A6_9STRA|mmetsp:Transcript_1162/g.1074  ORF Transcript_1162/g.1074 Transcript_1162/m.1074 type:complete len:230 (+) Transcript_1162:250-939(+)
MAAVRASGQIPANGKYYTHEDWNTVSKLEDDSWGSSYQWSKTESERRALEISKKHHIPLTTLCPPFIFGPPSSSSSSLSKDGSKSSHSYSIEMVQSWMNGDSPVQSRLCVDVRDIAKAQVIASNLSHTIGKRYIVSTEARISSQKMAHAIIQSCDNDDNNINNNITCDTTFAGGAIPIGQKEVECAQRCYDELNGLTCRPVEDTMRDMAKVLLKTKTTPPSSSNNDTTQ